MSAEKEIVSARDFHPTRWAVLLRNLSSGMSVSESDEISILEINEKELVFDLPERCCVASHNVHVTISQVFPVVEQPIYFEFTGKVRWAESTDDGRLRAAIELIQFDKQSWSNFLNGFAENQEQITAFLKAAKGY